MLKVIFDLKKLEKATEPFLDSVAKTRVQSIIDNYKQQLEQKNNIQVNIESKDPDTDKPKTQSINIKLHPRIEVNGKA